MENKNLEDIVFDRLNHMLEMYSIKIIVLQNPMKELKSYCVSFRGQILSVCGIWSNVHDLLFNDASKSKISLFNLCQLYNDTLLTIDPSVCKDKCLLGKILLGKTWSVLKCLKANSYEEMLLKMDLMGI